MKNFWQRFGKRSFDLVLAAFLIVAAFPLASMIAVALLIFYRGNVFFVQSRVGLDEKQFRLIKFSSMTGERDLAGELLTDEQRITSFGNVLRRTSLDELPQLFLILKGDMSFVGPRPLPPEYLGIYTSEHRLRHAVRPGLTGLAQANGRNLLTWKQKLDLDILYAENISLHMDIKVLLKTIYVVCRAQGVSPSASVPTMKKLYKGYNSDE